MNLSKVMIYEVISNFINKFDTKKNLILSDVKG